MLDPTEWRWTCHVCGDERPDAQISVLRVDVPYFGALLTVNVRYCNDRLACLRGAPAADLVQGVYQLIAKGTSNHEQSHARTPGGNAEP